MTVLRVPPLPPNRFKDHFRGVILDAVRRSAEEQAEAELARGRRRRARRADRTAERAARLLDPTVELERTETLGPRLRTVGAMLWLLSLAGLGVVVALNGLHFWGTSIADGCLIGTTLLWLLASIIDDARDRPEPVVPAQE